jgi:hypothetical protein
MLESCVWALGSGVVSEEFPEGSMEAQEGACSSQAVVFPTRFGVPRTIGLYRLVAPEIEAVPLVVEQAKRLYQHQRYSHTLSPDEAQEQLILCYYISTRSL